MTVQGVRTLRDIEKYYGTQIVRSPRSCIELTSDNGVLDQEEIPFNVAELL